MAANLPKESSVGSLQNGSSLFKTILLCCSNGQVGLAHPVLVRIDQLLCATIAPARRHTPIRRYADTPTRRHAATPTRRYADTPLRRAVSVVDPTR